jgi:hypothetical protein
MRYFLKCALIFLISIFGVSLAYAEDCSKFGVQNPYEPDDGGKAMLDCFKRQNQFLDQSIKEIYENTLEEFKVEPLPKPTPMGPAVGYNGQSGEVFVNGFRFDVDDETSALKSLDYLDYPRKNLPAGFYQMTPDAYGRYIKSIKNGTRPKNAFRKAQARLKNAPNFWECILKEMQDVDNDLVAKKINNACREKAPNRTSKDLSSMFGIKTDDECIVQYARNSSSKFAASQIKRSCQMLYPIN